MRAFLLACAIVLGAAAAAEACPDFTQWGESYQASGPQLYNRRDFNVVAGGENYIWDCPSIKPGTDRGAGYFTTAPDFTFDLSKMSGYQLVVSVVSLHFNFIGYKTFKQISYELFCEDNADNEE